MLRNLEIVPATESWSELLEWVNRSMPVEAPNHNKSTPMRKVEDCGHGVPYVLMLPTMLPIIHTPLLTSRVKVPAKTDYEAVANLKIMQDALHRNGIVIPDVLANGQQKLIGRNFQANLQLLQWFRGLHVALQQCGIEAGEGRIILATPSGENSVSSLSSPPASVVRAESRRRAESVNPAKPESQVLREVRAADSQGDAAAAAAVTLLSEHRSRSHQRSQSRNSQLEASVLNSAHSASLPVHHQQLPEKVPPQRPGPPRHESSTPSHHDVRETLDHSLPKPVESCPSPAPPLTESRTTPLPPPPPPGTKQVRKSAARAPAASQTRKVVEHPTSPTQRKEARPTPAATATPAPAPTPAVESPKDQSEGTKSAAVASNVAPHRHSSAPRRVSTPIESSAGTRRNGTPRRVEPSTANSLARTPASGRSGVVFKAMPARLSTSSSGHRRASDRSGGTPRTAETTTGNTPKAAGTRRASTPKRTAPNSDRTTAWQSGESGAARRPGSRPTKPVAKPIIALSAAAPGAAPSHDKARTIVPSAPADEPTPAPSEPAPAGPTSIIAADNNTKSVQAATPAPNEQPADADVLQLRIDRQFYYDKLRAIEELVDFMEAKKKQECKAKTVEWGTKDEEMLDFTNSVRSVLYAEN